MTLSSLIEKLKNATSSDPDIDREIARATRNMNMVVGNLAYTSSLDAAIELAKLLAPNQAVACSWEDGLGSAKVGDGPIAQGISPEIALCLATLGDVQGKLDQLKG